MKTANKNQLIICLVSAVVMFCVMIVSQKSTSNEVQIVKSEKLNER